MTLSLHNPDPLFLGAIVFTNNATIVSKKADLEKGEGFQTDPIGTGPYQMDRFDVEKGIYMSRHPDYWGEAGKVEKIEILYIADTTARTLALLSGDVDMIEGVRAPGWIPSIQAQMPDLLFDMTAPGSFNTMFFNLTKAPLDNLQVRQAIIHGINRDEIVQALTPMSNISFTLNPPNYPTGFQHDDLPEDLRYDFDPEKAKALLADAGFKNGLTIPVNTSQREDYSSYALIIQEQLRAIGVTIDLNIMDHSAYHADNRKDLNTIPINSSSLPPIPLDVYNRYASSAAEVKNDGKGGGNYSHYGTAMPGIDDKLAAMLQATSFDDYVEARPRGRIADPGRPADVRAADAGLYRGPQSADRPRLRGQGRLCAVAAAQGDDRRLRTAAHGEIHPGPAAGFDSDDVSGPDPGVHRHADPARRSGAGRAGRSGAARAAGDLPRADGAERSAVAAICEVSQGHRTLDLGRSLISDVPVAQLLMNNIPHTAGADRVAVLMGLVMGIPLGVMAATHRNKAPDDAMRIYSLIGYAIPDFYLGAILLIVFSLKLGWFPINGAGDGFWDRMYHIFLPALTLAHAEIGLPRPADPDLAPGGDGPRLHPDRAGQGRGRAAGDLSPRAQERDAAAVDRDRAVDPGHALGLGRDRTRVQPARDRQAAGDRDP